MRMAHNFSTKRTVYCHDYVITSYTTVSKKSAEFVRSVTVVCSIFQNRFQNDSLIFNTSILLSKHCIIKPLRSLQ